jgi:hypothetical protein
MAVVESADAIAGALEGIGFDDYCNSRLIRAAVEREFITIGEALNNLWRVDSACLPAWIRLCKSSAFATSSPMNTAGWMMHLFGCYSKIGLAIARHLCCID